MRSEEEFLDKLVERLRVFSNTRSEIRRIYKKWFGRAPVNDVEMSEFERDKAVLEVLEGLLNEEE